EGPGHDLGAAIVPVEPGLGDEDADLALAHLRAPRILSAVAWIFARSPGTSFQSNPLPSPVQRGIRWRWKCGTDWKAAAPVAWRRVRPSAPSAARSAVGARRG